MVEARAEILHDTSNPPGSPLPEILAASFAALERTLFNTNHHIGCLDYGVGFLSCREPELVR